MPYECQRRKKTLHFKLSSCIFLSLTALAIRCYVCAPNITNSSANMCGDPTDTINCTDSFYVSCISISITGKASNIVGFTVYSLNCGPKLLCSEAYKDYTCDSIKNATPEAPGVELSNCEISCCQEDFCNKPLGVSSASSFPRSTTPGPAGSTVTVKLSVGSTNFPLNCALFGILGVISVAVTNIFWTICLSSIRLQINEILRILWRFLMMWIKEKNKS